MSLYVTITEENDWEGERWLTVIPLPKGDDRAAIEMLGDLPDFSTEITDCPPGPYASDGCYAAECYYVPYSKFHRLAEILGEGHDEAVFLLYKGKIRGVLA